MSNEATSAASRGRVPFWACVTCGVVMKAERVDVCTQGHADGVVAVRKKGEASEGRVLNGEYLLLKALPLAGASAFRAVHLKHRRIVTIALWQASAVDDEVDAIALAGFADEARRLRARQPDEVLAVSDEPGGPHGPRVVYLVARDREHDAPSWLADPAAHARGCVIAASPSEGAQTNRVSGAERTVLRDFSASQPGAGRGRDTADTPVVGSVAVSTFETDAVTEERPPSKNLLAASAPDRGGARPVETVAERPRLRGKVVFLVLIVVAAAAAALAAALGLLSP